MAVRKIIFQEEEPLHYHLLAIHSVLTDYRLAFFLNKHLNIELKRAFEDLDISRQDGFYSFFQYEDEDNLLNWNLISNSSYTNVKNEIKESLLFKNTQVELKKFKLINQIIKSINEIPNIISVYSLNLNNIKNKENLNFS